MKLWWGRAESNLDRHARQHEALLQRATEIAREAQEQKEKLVAKANGHLAEFAASLGAMKDAGKS